MIAGATLSSYFARRYLATTLQFFVGVAVIIFLADFTELTRRASAHPSYTVMLGMIVSALRLPLILQMAMPFVILLVSMTTLMALNRKYELVVTRAAGVSAWQFLAPLCIVSLLLGVMSTVALNPIAARALASAQEIEATLMGSGAARPAMSQVPWLRQSTDEGATIIGAAHSAREGQLLSEVTFIRLHQNGTVRERIDARQAELVPGAWEIRDAIVLRRGNTPEQIESMRLKSNLDPVFLEERFTPPETVSVYDLPHKIAAARSFGLSGNAFATQFHSLVALPFQLMAMTLIAATVTMRFTRMGQPISIIVGGIVTGFLLYVVTAVMRAFGSAGIVPPVAAAWFPVLLAGLYGVTFLLYKEDG